MIWRALLPFLRPLVPVAVDYAKSRMQAAAEANERAAAAQQSVESVEARLADVEARMELLAGLVQQNEGELAALRDDVNARMKSGRMWMWILVGWNVALTAGLIVALLR